MGIHNPHFYYPSASNESPKQRKYPLANCLNTIHPYHRAIAKPRHIFGSECALATDMERGAAHRSRGAHRGELARELPLLHTQAGGDADATIY